MQPLKQPKKHTHDSLSKKEEEAPFKKTKPIAKLKDKK